MRRWYPRLLRYIIGVFVLFWVVAGQVSILVFVYSLIEPHSTFIPQLNRELFGLVLIGTMLGTIGIGYYRFGSLTAVIATVTAWVDDSSDEDETVVEGRVLADDFAWRVRYQEGGRITADYRECPRCGQEVIERHLPSDIVLEPNTAFDPSTESREAAAKVWHDVTGTEKADDRGETLALTCPDCNVSEPGSKELLDGKDAVISRFRRHIEAMKRPNPKRYPFESYRQQAQTDRNTDPTPADIWDVYVDGTDADDILPVRGQFTQISTSTAESNRTEVSQ